MALLHGFELVKEQEVRELKTLGRLYKHQKSAARLLSLENEDENKVFGVTFRTPPGDSTGIAHIMEHSVLCGSRRYPLKKPFVELVKGSLNTFLNAFTFPDKTCYPVASQNLQDFYNLIDVYMDAVLHPLITPQTLEQEGWHYHLEELSAPLRYKGVVFNEMKGAYSSPDNLFYRSCQQLLFPDNTYGYDSGGAPPRIPELTYAKFKSFHETYYHPSNSWIFFYGDDDPKERLRVMDSYLQDFNARPVSSAVALQPSFGAPRRSVVPYDPGEDVGERKGMLAVNWLLDETADAEKILSWQVLAHALIGSPASPLRKALIDSGLGEDLTGAGLEDDLRQAYFSTGLKGVRALDGIYEQVEELILETLRRLAKEGIDPETVAASLNTVEFRLRENNTGAFPRGLLIMLRALRTWLHDMPRLDFAGGRDPFAPLAYEAPLETIKARLESGDRLFESLIQKDLLENPHRLTVILQPEPGLGKSEEAAEERRLAGVREGLSPQRLGELVEKTHLMKELQERPDPPEMLAVVPSLKLSDLDPSIKTIPLELSELVDCPVLYHELFTNGIVYLDVGFNLHALPQEYLPYAPLFGRALLEMGAADQDFVQLLQRIGRTTGGIRPAILTLPVVGAPDSAAWLFLRGKATYAGTGELLSILHDILSAARLDNPERFRQIVLEEKADLEAMLTPAGHRLVNIRLRAMFHEANWVEELTGGISHLFFLRRLADEVEANWPAVLERLETLRRLLVNRKVMLVNATLDGDHWDDFQSELASGLLRKLPGMAHPLSQWRRDFPQKDEGLVIPAKVNYVGKGLDLGNSGYSPHGSTLVIQNYLRTTWLWEKVRVQGGAYGAFSQLDHRSGVFTFFSYRDPNLLSTLEAFDQSGQFLRQLDAGRFTSDELVKNIIGAIGDLDAYQLPDAKGYTSLARYLSQESDAMRQERRDQVLSTSQEDFRRFGGWLEEALSSGKVLVMGSEEAILKANADRPGWLEMQTVL